MKLYVVYAADELYQGLHGLEDWSIWECEDENEALNIGYENSIQIINSYSCIYEQLDQDIKDYMEDGKNWSEEDIDQLTMDIYDEDTYYNVWEIDEDITKEYDVNILEKMLIDDPEDFIKTYCKYE